MFNNRLNGKWSNNGDEHEGDKDDAYIESEESSIEKLGAIELASSMRGQWLIGMALYELLIKLGENQKDELTKENITIRADMDDVHTLVEYLFPLYKNVTEKEDSDEQ